MRSMKNNSSAVNKPYLLGIDALVPDYLVEPSYTPTQYAIDGIVPGKVSDVMETVVIESFFSDAKKYRKINKHDIQDLMHLLGQIQNKNFIKPWQHRLIKQALKKEKSYSSRFFSKETWLEWAEDKTNLGKVFSYLIEQIKSGSSFIKKIFPDEVTVKRANHEAKILLLSLNSRKEKLNINQFSPNPVPQSSSFVKIATRLGLNAVALRAGVPLEPLILANMIELAPTKVKANLFTSFRNVGKNLFSTVGDIAMSSLVGNIGGQIGVAIEQLGYEMRATIQEAERSTNAVILNFSEQGKLLISKAGEEIRITADATFASLFPRIDLSMQLAGAELRASINCAEEAFKTTLSYLPEVGRKTTEIMLRTFANTLLDLTFGVSELSKLCETLRNNILEGRLDIKQILEFVTRQNQPTLSSSDKQSLYQALIKMTNVAEVSTQESQKIISAICLIALNDEKMWVKTPRFFGLMPSIDHLKELFNSVPDTEIRDLLLALDHKQGDINIANTKRLLNMIAYKENKSVKQPTIPKGAILAFDAEECPEGWEEFQKASGRMLIGKNSEFPLGKTGGKASHTLSIEEMPAHSHRVMSDGPRHGSEPTATNFARRAQSVEGGALWGGNANFEYIVMPSNKESTLFSSSTDGESKPYATISPYTSVLWCKKRDILERKTKKEDKDNTVEEIIADDCRPSF